MARLYRQQIAYTHLQITRMRNRDQYRKSMVELYGLVVEESKMHTFSRI